MFSLLRPGVVGFADRSLSWVRIADSRDSLEASSGLRQLPMLWETRRQGAINSPQQRKGRHPSPKGGARRVLDESRKWYTRLWTLPQRRDLVFPEACGGRLIYMVPRATRRVRCLCWYLGMILHCLLQGTRFGEDLMRQSVRISRHGRLRWSACLHMTSMLSYGGTVAAWYLAMRTLGWRRQNPAWLSILFRGGFLSQGREDTLVTPLRLEEWNLLGSRDFVRCLTGQPKDMDSLSGLKSSLQAEEPRNWAARDRRKMKRAHI